MAGSRVDGRGPYHTRGGPPSAWSFRTQRHRLCPCARGQRCVMVKGSGQDAWVLFCYFLGR